MIVPSPTTPPRLNPVVESNPVDGNVVPSGISDENVDGNEVAGNADGIPVEPMQSGQPPTPKLDGPTADGIEIDGAMKL